MRYGAVRFGLAFVLMQKRSVSGVRDRAGAPTWTCFGLVPPNIEVGPLGREASEYSGQGGRTQASFSGLQCSREDWCQKTTLC